ncbi:MAG: GntR family transcriptional regulator [Oscillospiraceae bacterium]|nr:GntR family transcriptional regulator [Oscillospiraceae bacterium]
MDWNFRNDLPIYSQLVEQIKLGIVSGIFAPGERLASVRDMAMEAGVNPNTMQRALQELERDGLVYSQRTSGRFVTEDETVIDNAKKTLATEQVKTFLSAMEKLGYDRAAIIAMLEEEKKEEKNNADT